MEREHRLGVMLRWKGTRQFGPPDANIQSRLEQVDELSQLQHFLDRLVDHTAGSWEELLRP